MKKLLIIAIAAAFCSISQATTITASSIPQMSYQYGYEWGINLGSGVQLASASITLNATVANTTQGYLFISLLDTTPVSGITSTSGNTEASPATDFWASQVTGNNSAGKPKYVSIATLHYGTSWGSGNNDGKTITINITGNALTDLNSYLSTSPRGFNIGFDPDCIYNFSSLSFTYTTRSVVPDTASTVFLLGAGLLGLEIFRRKFALA